MEYTRDVIDWRTRCAALIPCFNAASTIADVVRRVRLHLPSVLVMDDGSTDDTARHARAAGAEVAGSENNRGKGAALRTGIRLLHERGFAWVLMLDGDGQHAPEETPAFFRRAEQTGAMLVVGNRMADPAGMPWFRRRINGWMSRDLSGLTGTLLPDSQCGFRLAQLAALTTLKLATSRFEIESEMLVAVIKAGKRVEFIPIRVIYQTGPSRIRPLTDAWRWIRWRRQQ